MSTAASVFGPIGFVGMEFSLAGVCKGHELSNLAEQVLRSGVNTEFP